MAERQAAAICEIVKLFPSSRLMPGIEGEIRQLHGGKCGWCDYSLEELRTWRESEKPTEREEDAWWRLSNKARRSALEKALGRSAV